MVSCLSKCFGPQSEIENDCFPSGFSERSVRKSAQVHLIGDTVIYNNQIVYRCLVSPFCSEEPLQRRDWNGRMSMMYSLFLCGKKNIVVSFYLGDTRVTSVLSEYREMFPCPWMRPTQQQAASQNIKKALGKRVVFWRTQNRISEAQFFVQLWRLFFCCCFFLFTCGRTICILYTKDKSSGLPLIFLYPDEYRSTDDVRSVYSFNEHNPVNSSHCSLFTSPSCWPHPSILF